MDPGVRQFDELRDAYYRAWCRFHPTTAVTLGIPGHAGRLEPIGDDEVSALVVLNEKLLVSLDEMSTAALDPDRLIDLELLTGAAFLEIEELVKWDWRRRDPQRYLPLEALYLLTIRDVSEFPQALMTLLQATPAYLRDARQQLLVECEGIPPLWLESAVTAAEAGVDYLHHLTANPKVSAHAKQLRQLPAALEAACTALRDYAHFLQRDIGARAAGDFAVGVDRFDHLLRYRHFLKVSAQDLRSLGTRLFDQTQRDLKRVCQALTGHDDVLALARELEHDHPSGDRLLAAYTEQMRAAREFVAREQFVAMPARERLAVVATPDFLRHQIPFAAYMEPAPDDPQQQGYYYVTPAQGPASLAQHHRSGLPLTCVHEAYPGHHLQFVTANRTPAARTLPRLVNPSATLYEGWALYCEQLMLERGFLDRPEQEFMMLKDRLWRALRVVIDVDIQTRGLSVSDASTLLERHLGMPAAQARADLTWYSRAATVPLGYATGWALINAARDRLRVEQPELAPRSFHDRLLASGSIALPLALRRGFGAELVARVQDMVFQPSVGS